MTTYTQPTCKCGHPLSLHVDEYELTECLRSTCYCSEFEPAQSPDAEALADSIERARKIMYDDAGAMIILDAALAAHRAAHPKPQA
mgnify:CR=1 FL=1